LHVIDGQAVQPQFSAPLVVLPGPMKDRVCQVLAVLAVLTFSM
jgi:hypothetical protein